MWLAAGAGCWERSEKQVGGEGGKVGQSSPIRLILEWEGKQRLPRQQLAGEVGHQWILFCLFESGSRYEVSGGHTHAHTHTVYTDWRINNGLRCRLFWSMLRQVQRQSAHTKWRGQIWRYKMVQGDRTEWAWTCVHVCMRHKLENRCITIQSTCV